MSKDIDAVVEAVTSGMSSNAGSGDSQPAQDQTQTQTHTPPEHFSETDYNTENDPDFDPDKVPVDQRKEWPKKFSNALSRRDKERAKLREENDAKAKRIAELEGNLKQQNPQQQTQQNTVQTVAKNVNYTPEQQALVDAVVAKKPDMKDFKTYGEYMEKLTDWKADVRDIQRDIAQEIKDTAAKSDSERTVSEAQNGERIAKQAREFIKVNPEYKALLEANADIVSAYPKHVADAFMSADRPELAFAVLAKTEGALEALGKMNPMQAAMYIGRAEQIGRQQFAGVKTDQNTDAQAQQKVSSAPTPMGLPKMASRGGKSLEKMNADELLEHLGID